MLKTLRCSLLVSLATVVFLPAAGFGQTRTIRPTLGFPEAGLDDPASYQGYKTRFFRDAKRNTVQVYVDSRSGRVVNLLADAVDESVGFTVRDSLGKPLSLGWGSDTAVIGLNGKSRSISYTLVSNARRIDIGWILLGSMRVERDLGYSGRGLEPFATPTFRLPEQEELIANLERLPAEERNRELNFLHARDVAELRARLQTRLVPGGTNLRAPTMVTVTQPSLDAQTSIQLELFVDPGAASLSIEGPIVVARSLNGGPIQLHLWIMTDAPALTPLSRDEIFNSAFLRFFSDARRTSGASSLRYRRLEREVTGLELLSSRQKLMAGLPNYATYFGRDMMMTALMMEPIWADVMYEHVIASALRKLGPEGDVSHEEALGGQAIRENASEYNAHLKEYFRLRESHPADADTALARGRALLVNLQTVRENYHMRDDEFQLPVLAARYLTNPAVPTARKAAFLMDSSDGKGPRVLLLLRELALVSNLADPYARDPNVQNLVGSPKIDSTHWRSISWRDSGAGYANGRFAMDINAIWVPRALESISQIVGALHGMGFSESQMNRLGGAIIGTPLHELAMDPAFMRKAVENWNGAVRHFVVSLSANEVQSSVQKKLQSLPAEERNYWQRVLTTTGADRQPLEFLALSLDSAGRPIGVVNTDPSTWLLLRNRRDTSAAARARALRDVRATMRAYPVGLFVDRLGPLVANDAYAPPSVWEAFDNDRYHSPRVVWGREVNLFMLGLAKEISSSKDRMYVNELRNALTRTNAAVEASGLKHTELWSYEIKGGRLDPIRYGAATDIQLWNVTDLAVQFVLSSPILHQ
ncbi:MAG: hypothetical protein ABR582_06910 [Gemmatimonadaceae bacterium]